MLDKLNKVADMIGDLIAAQPAPKKKKMPAEGSAEEEALESPAQEQREDSPAARAQKSMRKNMGGLKEPT